jgi:hypothetical protein
MGQVCLVSVESSGFNVYFYVEEGDKTFTEENIIKALTDSDNQLIYCGEDSIDLDNDCVNIVRTPEDEYDFTSGAIVERDNQGQIVLYTGVMDWSFYRPGKEEQ